jgi:hypothetical protein
MQIRYNTPPIAQWTSVAVTVAALAKTFKPFYWIGSTAIFAGASALGALLILINRRSLRDDASRIVDVLVLLALFYAMVAANFIVFSRPAVPLTYLLGILIFNGLFLTFGLAAARAQNTVLQVLLCAAAIYAIALIQHAVRFGRIMGTIGIDDIFEIGDWSIYRSFHQNIGLGIGLGALAALGLGSSRVKHVFALAAIPVAMLLLFHIAARGALVALVGSIIFWALADCWIRSKSATILSAALIMIAVTIGSLVFYQRALHDHNVNSAELDAMSRTMRELQDSNPEFRVPIWTRAIHDIASEPGRLLFGRGIGMYPVNEGFGAPDWLLHRTEGSEHYVHNVHLEMLYEAGALGFLLFSMLTLFPLVASLRRWHLLSLAEKSIVSIYVFNLVSSEISGNLGVSYMEHFFFALSVGVIALKRADDVGASGLPDPSGVPIYDSAHGSISNPLNQ